MKLIMSQQAGLVETEVEIRYGEMNAAIQSLAKKIEAAESYLYGEENGRQYRIPLADILYIESVDRKTFIYTTSAVYRSELKLYRLLELLTGGDFVQVSKSCILNIDALENVVSVFNKQ